MLSNRSTLVLLCFYSTLPLLSVQTILLKQGKSIKGIVTGQNVDHVEVDAQNGKHLVIPKKSVLKIIYKDLAEIEEAKIRKEEEEKRKLEREKAIADKAEEIRKRKEQTAKSSDTKANESSNFTLGFRDSFILRSTNSDSLVSLASESAVCKPYSESSHFYWLFGSFRFREPNWKELLPPDGSPVRIRSGVSYWDLPITIIGGIAATITRKTFYIEICESKGARLISDAELQKMKDEAIEMIKTEQELKAAEEEMELKLLEKDLESLPKKR